MKPTFFQELKRRRVVRVALLYAAVTFAVVQGAEVLAPALLLPDWTLRLVVFLAILGFPVAMVLAWAFDMTPEGVKRTLPVGPDAVGDTDSAGDPDAGRPHPASASWVAPQTVGAAFVFVVLGMGAGWLLRSDGDSTTGGDADGTAASAANPAATSIAVLPFDDMSADDSQEYFADGMTEELLNVLARIPGIQVAARTSVFAFKGRAESVQTIGRELGVTTILEGSIRTDGQELRITAQLINVEDGFHLWSDTYDRELRSVFAVQDEIARAIADALRIPLGLEEERELVPNRTEDIDAYQIYLQARARYNARGTGVQEAIDLLEGVIARDATFAPAYASLAEAYAVRPFYTGPESDQANPDPRGWRADLDRADESARRALALDSTLIQAQTALANTARERWDWTVAEERYRRILDIDPSYAEAQSNLGEMLMSQERLEEALPFLIRSAELEPHHPVYAFQVGEAMVALRRFDEAEPWALQAVEVAPTSVFTWISLIWVYVGQERFAEAREAAANQPGTAAYRADFALMLDAMETRSLTAERRAAVERLQTVHSPVMFGTANVWLLQGDRDRAALAALDWVIEYPYGPPYGAIGAGQALRGHPLYEEARRRMGLPPTPPPPPTP